MPLICAALTLNACTTLATNPELQISLTKTRNQEVAAGGPLAIDPSQYRIALNKARSDLENARRQVGAGSAAVESARANLRAAQANELKAQQDQTRRERLRMRRHDRLPHPLIETESPAC